MHLFVLWMLFVYRKASIPFTINKNGLLDKILSPPGSKGTRL
jgi:hypothetical protein